MPRAFITGASGFIGGALLRALLQRGWEVRVLLRPGSDPKGLQGIEAPFERCPGDLRHRDSLRGHLVGCDLLFHVAARYSLWNPRPREIYEDNVVGTRNILEAAEEAGVSRVVYTSTVGVLRPSQDGRLADETSMARLDEVHGHYRRSKWQAEQCALEFARRGLPVVIVNPSAPVGPGDVKPTPTGRMIIDFLKGRMTGYTDTGLNLVAVEDVAEGHILAAAKGVPGQRYILGAENMTLLGVFRILSELTGVPVPRLRVPAMLLLPIALALAGVSAITRRPPFVCLEEARMARARMHFDIARARRDLGFKPGPVPAALERAVRWFRHHGYLSGQRGVSGPTALKAEVS